MNEQTNITDEPEDEHESTYALLTRSEDKSRNVFEMLIHPLLILGPLIAIWQFAQQPVKIPVVGWKAWIVFDASAQNNAHRGEFPTLPGNRHPEIKG
jgi:hypothetical protein